jgi:acyl-coenzyme A synthetase/AMP-(fatty) acid ligase
MLGTRSPEHVFLLAKLPRTGTGKLDRHTLGSQVTSDLAAT